MKLSLPFFKKKKKTQYFLALLLRDAKSGAVIFEEIDGAIRPVGKNEEYFKTDIEDAPIEELLEVLDKTISKAEEALPPNVETQKTVFGVKQDWVEESKIKKDYLVKLKKISDEFGLIPIGFLVIQEAIVHLIQKEEGAPVSAILVENDNKNLTVSLIRAGRIAETRFTQIEESAAKSVDKLLHHFDYEVLPSRIIILDDKESEELAQEFITHSWSKNLSFLHVPQISVLTKGFDARSVLFGAAQQMGFDVLGNTEGKIKNEEKKTKNEKAEEVKTTEKTEEELENKEETKEEGKISFNDFGFVEGEDIAKVEEKEQEEEKLESYKTEETEEKPQNSENAIAIQIKNENTNLVNTKSSKNYMKTFSKISQKMISIIPKSVVKLKINGGKLVFISPLIILVLIGIFLLYIFNLKATIVVNVKPKPIEHNQDITFLIDKPSDFSKNIVQGKTITVTEDGELSAKSTGTKEIGDKAKGSVTIYARFTEDKTFPKGTAITSSNNLDFILDSSVTIASSSADASSPAVTAKVSVTAKDIGKEFNLPSGTKFTFESFSSTTIVAKNDSAFSGGSKKEITVVSKNDIQKLDQDLPKKLEEKSRNDLNKKLTPDMLLLPGILSSDFIKKNYDKKEGEESPIITLKATVEFQGISYQKNNLDDFSKKLLKSDVQDLVFTENGIKYSMRDIKQKNDNEILAKLYAKAFLMPKLDNKKLTQELKGKSFDEANDLLSKIPQVSDVSVNLSPNLPLLPKILPQRSENISIVVKSNE